MKKDKYQITMPELQKLIKEEYANMAEESLRAEKIKARLKAINEELKTLPGTLSEVEATGTKKVKSTGWTGAGEGDVKYGEKFEKIGTHLKEDEEFEGDIEVGGEMEGPEMEEEMGYFEAKFAELGRELDAKVGSESEESEDAEEIGFGVESGFEDTEDGEEEMEDSVVADEEEEEDEDDMMNEDLEEPIEGETLAQDSEARFNDYMEKDKHVKEGVKKVGTTLLSEGFTPAQKSKMDAELERMKKLAKI